jgi:hypothetical protein
MSIKDCLVEVRDAVRNFLDETEANQLLEKVKSQIELNRASKKLEELESEVAEKILSDELKESLQIKINKIKDKKIITDLFKTVIEDYKDDPIKGLKAITVGIESFKFKSRYSVDNAQLDYKSYIGLFGLDLEKGIYNSQTKKMESLLPIIQNRLLHKDIIKEAIDNPFLREEPNAKDVPMYGNQQAYEVAKIVKKWNDIVLLDKNNLGAWISKEPGYIFRQAHVIEKMLKAAGRNIKDEKLHKEAWIKDILDLLNQERTFKGADPRKFLEDVWNNIISGHSIRTIDQSNYVGTKNIAKRQSAERVLHFKNGESFYKYDIKYGHADLQHSLLMNFEKAAQDNGLMKMLGTNPRANLETLIQMLRNHYGGTKAAELSFGVIEKEFKQLDGSMKSIVGSQAGITISEIESVAKGLSTTGKLDSLPFTSITDIPYMIGEVRHQGMNVLSFANTLFTELKRTTTPEELKEIMGPFTLFADNFRSQFTESFSGKDTMAGKMSAYQANVFKFIGQNTLMHRFKRAMIVAMQHHYGNLTDRPLLKLPDDAQRVLGLYGIDSGRWELIRKTTLKDFEGRKHLTVENIQDMSDDAVLSYLKTQDPKVKKFTKNQIDQTKKEIQSQYRMLLIDRTMHGPVEPGARERALMNRGVKKGTIEGLLLGFMGQFKTFGLSVYTKVIEKEINSYGPGKFMSRTLPAIGSVLISTSIFGYAAFTAKDLLFGKEPMNPFDPKTALRAFLQGGGGTIYADLLNAEFNRTSGGVASTVLGPVFSDIEGLLKTVGDVYSGDYGKAGSRAIKLLEANTPIDAWMVKPFYNYYIGWQLKEMMDPGYFSRLQNSTRKNLNQEFWLKP